MNQINFRINDEGYIIIKEMAEHANISIAELSKQLVLESLKEKQLKEKQLKEKQLKEKQLIYLKKEKSVWNEHGNYQDSLHLNLGDI